MTTVYSITGFTRLLNNLQNDEELNVYFVDFRFYGTIIMKNNLYYLSLSKGSEYAPAFLFKEDLTKDECKSIIKDLYKKEYSKFVERYNDIVIVRETLEEIIESFPKEVRDLEKSGVEFSTVVIDSYDNIK